MARLEAMTLPYLLVHLKPLSHGQGSGWDAYSRYSAHTVPLRKARGGTILWAGGVRAVPLGSYAAGNVDRENGTERHLILATRVDYSTLGPPPHETPETAHGPDVGPHRPECGEVPRSWAFAPEQKEKRE